MEKLKYNEVTYAEFDDYKSALHMKIDSVMPDFDIETQSMGKQTFHYIKRWDFSGGKDKKYPYNVFGGIFAYSSFNGQYKYFILNKEPLEKAVETTEETHNDGK